MAVTPTVAIIGRPNVGKSTLFNRLVGSRSAITARESGTTRDVVVSKVNWGKFNFTLTDTAGLDVAGDDIDKQARQQLEDAVRAASVVVVVVDGTTEVTNQDRLAAKLAHKSQKPVILAINKSDVKGASANFQSLGIKDQVKVSAIHGAGSGDLLDRITTHLHRVGDEEQSKVLTLALLGRPNVGKSSLLNALTGKAEAIVSTTSGTTRDVRAATLEQGDTTIQLLDTAGLRRRGKIESGVEKFSVIRTGDAIDSCDVAIVVMDATELGTAGDQHIAGMVKDAGKGLILVINKWDLPEKDDKTQARVAKRLAADFQFVWWAPLVFTSATTGLNVKQLLELATEIYQRRQQAITTGPLNRVVEEMVRKHPPAGLKRLQPKINYATQTGSNPPEFTFFASHHQVLHFSYPRYLENGLRQAYDFAGTPIALKFRSKRRGE